MATTHAPTAAPPERRANRWLRAGAVAGPLFAVLSFAQVPLHPGLDLTKHAFSFLLLGPDGRLQTLNFVVAGLLFVASGRGLRLSLSADQADRTEQVGQVGQVGQASLTGRAGLWAHGLVTAVGAGMIFGGLFPPDPSFGYPAGAPAGVPAELSGTSIVHAIAFFTAMLSWCALLAVLAGYLHRRGQRGWALAAGLTAVGLLVVPVASTQPFGTVLLYVVATIAWVVTSAVFLHLDRRVTHIDGRDL